MGQPSFSTVVYVFPLFYLPFLCVFHWYWYFCFSLHTRRNLLDPFDSTPAFFVALFPKNITSGVSVFLPLLLTSFDYLPACSVV